MSPIDAQIIHTTRLDLMPLRAEHAEQMATVLSDPDLYRFIGGAPTMVATKLSGGVLRSSERVETRR